jgi:hypothetical protein
MKRLMMLLMLWTGLITAVYIVDTAILWRDAPTTSTENSNIASADAANLIYYSYTGPTASGPWTSYQAEKIGTFKVKKTGSVTVVDARKR